MTIPRGIRNNNPLNIRRGSSKWLGLKRRQTDPLFCQFETIHYGYRAAFKLMQTYYEKYGINTIDALISRWAPGNENDTGHYVACVMYCLERNGFDYGEREPLPAPWRDKRLWCAIVRAMLRQECGAKAADSIYAAGDISRGYNLAFVTNSIQ